MVPLEVNAGPLSPPTVTVACVYICGQGYPTVSDVLLSTIEQILKSLREEPVPRTCLLTGRLLFVHFPAPVFVWCHIYFV